MTHLKSYNKEQILAILQASINMLKDKKVWAAFHSEEEVLNVWEKENPKLFLNILANNTEWEVLYNKRVEQAQLITNIMEANENDGLYE